MSSCNVIVNVLVSISYCFYGNSIAAACWVFHYGKRLLETIFVHRFSHATMPLGNLFKVSESLHMSAIACVEFAPSYVSTELFLLLVSLSYCIYCI